MLMNSQITATSQDFFLQAGSSNKGAAAKKPGSGLSFKDFLQGNIKDNKAVKINDIKAPDRNKITGGLSSEGETRVEKKTFRQLVESRKAEAEKPEVYGKRGLQSGKGSSMEDLPDDNKVPDNIKPKMIISCLAQILGINVEELAGILEEAGIKLEELASVDIAIADRLQNALGLDNESGAVLGRILQKIENQVDEAMAMLGKEAGNAGLSWKQLEQLMQKALEAEKAVPEAGTAKDSKSGPMELSETVFKIRRLLKDISAEIKMDETALDGKIQSSVQSLVKDTTSLIKAEAIKASKAEVPLADESEKASAEGENEAEGPDGFELKETARLEGSSPDNTVLKPEAQEMAFNITGVVNRVNAAKMEAASGLERLNMPVPDKVILSQVIEKVKVVMTGDKAEMAMELKPESLGKLSLKVITENGIVMAKFIAENQQVKEVLETNMQLLKDSLQRQGLNVQGFSVSVRQDSQNGQESYRQEGNIRQYGHRPAYSGRRAYADISGMERHLNMNPYLYEGNTINITA